MIYFIVPVRTAFNIAVQHGVAAVLLFNAITTTADKSRKGVVILLNITVRFRYEFYLGAIMATTLLLPYALSFNSSGQNHAQSPVGAFIEL